MAVKVFVNHVDLYTGVALTQLLSESVVGATVEGLDEDEEEEDLQSEGAARSEKTEEKYTVIGTLSNPEATIPKGVETIVQAADRAALLDAIMDCQYIIYDISKSAEQAEEAGYIVSKIHEQLDNWEGQKTFVCLSTIMTWANTKPIDPEDDEAPFQEGDYRKRRAHKNFKAHIDTEKLVTKCGKKTRGKLGTFVVASGLPYGMGEDTFHPLFRMAWELKVPALPIYGSEQSLVPTIHVKDLANIALHILEGHAETRYMLAIDEGQSTIRELTMTLATRLGPGTAVAVTAEEAFLEEDVTQVEFDMLTVNLRMEPASVADMPFEWVSREGFVENIDTTITEYKKKRNLTPVKMCVLGPPACGKTALARMLSDMYKLPRIGADTVVQDTIEELKRSAARLESAEEDADMEQVQCSRCRTLSLLVVVVMVVAWCGVHGVYVCANKAAQACLHAGFVFALDAEDEQLKERVRHLQQEEAEALQATETEFLERLSAYRAANTEDTTVLNFFDFHEIHPKHLDAIANTTEDLAKAVRATVGAPHNYGPTKEEREEMERLAAEIKAQEVARAAREQAEKETIEEAKRKGAQAMWEAKVQEIKKQQQEALDEAALPLRTFLMRHVMPTLTEGLLDVCKAKPDDPVDYLAEFLFRNNPQID
ncbi:hypothetical protein PTSG_11784 [Salpingoeca rosetta]|uniref:Adenylate kinase 7 n=1 Tax=Salpingoeca rosetta (strain ATCC 50818 / BSB-021) TaxID=946362 RepID=F2TZ03_SALR5|nr:uncharacterized protein PTSG_11784 [Salpingoeca rosetta]EGD78827.1 hypothetical protein PTSG_11784 [Salpingoeca rosetta]|eukprot:XP_004997783.1 hypothetical protein PTSG_11784 [Salpingoeca rosetta]